MGKRYDILCLPPQEGPVYFIVEAWADGEGNDDATKYLYEERQCPSDFFHNLDTIIAAGDTDPHGLFEYVRTTDVLDFPGRAHEPDVEWAKVVPEAFGPSLDLQAGTPRRIGHGK